MLRRRGIPGLGRWFTTKADSGGGVLIDLGPHLTDLVLHLMGRPQVARVSAAGSSNFGKPPEAYKFTNMWAGPPDVSGAFDVEDGASAMLRCANGATVTLEASWASHLPDGTLSDGVTLFGTKAAMHFDIWGDHVLVGNEVGARWPTANCPSPKVRGGARHSSVSTSASLHPVLTGLPRGPAAPKGSAFSSCLMRCTGRSTPTPKSTPRRDHDKAMTS